MSIKVKTDGQRCHIVLDGEMTVFVAQELRDALIKPLTEATEIEVDLSQVSEIDTAGLQLMVMAKLESIGRGSELRFTGHSAAVQQMIDMTDLGSFFGDPVVIPSKAD